MEHPFFIMIYSQNGDSAMPMTDGDSGDVKFFGTEDEARIAGNEHFYAKAFGFEIFEIGLGA
jgi:hypothetical protein